MSKQVFNFELKTNNALKVTEQMKKNAKVALKAIGIATVGFVVDKMEKGYDKPIRITGDLQRSIAFGNETSTSVDIGSNLEYAEVVHDGSPNMKGRPYLRDGIIENQDKIQTIFNDYLGQNLE